MIDSKRLIDVDFPIQEIADAVQKERKKARNGIGTLHTWWSRKPLAVCRAAIFAALVDMPAEAKEIDYLRGLLVRLAQWDRDDPDASEVITQAQSTLRGHYQDRPPRLLDPFMGGGSTGVEGLRLGCETHAVELSPVAHLIELCTLVYPQQFRHQTDIVSDGPGQAPLDSSNDLARDIRQWGSWVLDRAASDLAQWYGSTTAGEESITYHWARATRCANPDCGAIVPLVRHWWLANGTKRKIALRPVVDQASRKISIEVIDLHLTPPTNVVYDPNRGTVWGRGVSCPVCGYRMSLDEVRAGRQAGHLDDIPLAVGVTTPDSTRSYRAFNEAELEQFGRAGIVFASAHSREGGTSLPFGEIANLHLFGIRSMPDVHNARQGLSLIEFGRAIRSAYTEMLSRGFLEPYAKALATYLALALDRLVGYSTTFTIWSAQREQPVDMFSRPFLSMVWDYVEVNPLRKSRKWTSAVRQIADTVSRLGSVGRQPAIVHLGTATRLAYPSNHFDVIVADPPYFDNLRYSDLSELFSIWLRYVIGNLYPDAFGEATNARPDDLTINISQPSESESDDPYLMLLSRAFVEANRTLRVDGRLVLFTPYTKTTAGIVQILSQANSAGLVVSNCWPVPNESAPAALAAVGKPRTMTLVWVLRKSTTRMRGDFLRVRALVRARVRDLLPQYHDRALLGDLLHPSVLGAALEVFGRYEAVDRPDGQILSVSDVFDIVENEVVEFALVQRYLSSNSPLE